jgi:8-oxo-dGTP pyrophosphatase MutT (NUDIX family)
VALVSVELIVPDDAPVDLIRAAGGVPYRTDENGQREVACVYREARGDWTFPKGKLDVGENFEQCAVREVWEETGLYCQIERFIGTTNYTHRKGKPKIVAYFLMSVIGGDGLFQPNDEVDELRWVPIEHVRERLTWDRDQELFDLIVTLPELRAHAS